MVVRQYHGEKIIIMACSDCNTNCKHCYIGYNGNFGAKELNALCRKLNENYMVRLNGTELLLHPEYFNTIQYIGQTDIITNGIILFQNPDLIQKIIDMGINTLGISYHMYIHDNISQVSVSKIKSLLKQLESYEIDVDIRVTIDSGNYDKIKEMCQNAVSLNVAGIKFTNYMYTGSAKNLNTEKILSSNQIDYFFEQLKKARDIYPKDLLKIKRCGSFGNSKYGNFNCPAGKNLVVITPELKVYPCIFLIRNDLEIGYIENGRIMITKEIENNGAKCLAKEINNHNWK